MNILKGIFILTYLCLHFYSFNLYAYEARSEEIAIDSIHGKIAQHKYDLYTEGVTAQLAGEIEKAKKYFDQYISIEFKHKILNDIEIDILARYISIAKNEEDWAKICDLGSRLEFIDQQTREYYKNTAWMYLMYVHSLNMTNRCDDIDRIVQEGLCYVEHTYTPVDKEYYKLRFQHFISKLNKDDIASATHILNEIKRINNSTGQHTVDSDIHEAEQFLINEKEYGAIYDKNEFVESFSKNVVETALWTQTLGYSKVEGLWNSLINLAQNFLENTYFDEDDINDEDIWTKFITWYNVLINGFGRGFNLPDRAQLAYDLELTSKNFLDWHSSRVNKSSIRWNQILDHLDGDEIAIEFIPQSNEALVLSNDFNTPQIIKIDSITVNRISQYNSEDPFIINTFYRNESPLIDLTRNIKPYLKDKKTIYISGSNHFAQFNFGAIPYEGKTLDDSFKVIPMISTADVIRYKSRKKKKFQMISLFGDIDYENSFCPKIELNDRNDQWAYISDVPDKLRKGYDSLPYTKTEIDNIASMCNSHNITYEKFCGQDASELNLKECNYSVPSILHIATHTFLLPSYSFNALTQLSNKNEISRLGTVLSNTGLLFAGCNKSLTNGFTKGEDGILTAKEISHLNLNNIALVVLSSCSSGLGDLNNINGIVYGLTNAFRAAGCDQILISLWNVPDYTTSLFMGSFYENLLQGHNTRDSLKLAQAHLISLGYKDPYYWGAFVILD